MADVTSASIPPLHQSEKRPLTGAERQAAYRQRKKATASCAQHATALVPAIEPAPVTLRYVTPSPVTAKEGRPSFSPARLTLRGAALALAAVGITMNGWFARSLGSTDAAGYLFLAVGVASDAVALVLPSVCAGQWQVARRTTAAAGWAVWLMTFAFAISSSVGFASVNIADVTMARASRVTPAVTAAQGVRSVTRWPRATGSAGAARESSAGSARQRWLTGGKFSTRQCVRSRRPPIRRRTRQFIWSRGSPAVPCGHQVTTLPC